MIWDFSAFLAGLLQEHPQEPYFSALLPTFRTFGGNRGEIALLERRGGTPCTARPHMVTAQIGL